ncbi:DUF411 domain-containing protein [Paracidovorax avenae]|uniref:DUF411 domain-containing protein n=1 Tax=Paracidovorax avenae TaxID=80867 RepID=UPI000D227BCD|nr:hypothetical protein C8243_07620 [Paracidovorax avenae]AVT09287.1 hypothetical protein C8242_07075 [Paracidovorax avenae]
MNHTAHPTSSRRAWLASVLCTTAAGLPWLAHAARPVPIAIEVWKDPNCGCCKDWVDHMQANGFQATVHDTGNAAVREKLGLPQKLGSCHTALVGGYLVEGHVPAADVQRLLRDKPRALGLAVPGMPVGSPGMDGAFYDGRRDAHDVLLVARDGSARVFTSYSAQPAAAGPADHGATANTGSAPQAADLSEGEVVRWDAATRRITLRHGELRNLDMPPMTMVFRVREAVPAAAQVPGARVRFLAERDAGGFVASRIDPAHP